MNTETKIDMSSKAFNDGFNDGFDDGFDTPMSETGATTSLQFQSYDAEDVGGMGFADEVEEEPMLKDTDDYDENQEYPMYRMNFYRRYFNVETIEILARLRRAMLPIKVDFLDSIHSKPDLYGPFWTVSTLVFLVGVCGNISDRITNTKPNAGTEFEKISAAATFLYMYHAALPFLCWLYIRMRVDGVNISLIELLCLFGYANAIFVPAAILAIIHYEFVQWTACLMGMLVSLAVLGQSLGPTLRQANKSRALPIGVGIVLAQIGLTCALKFYFFRYVNK